MFIRRFQVSDKQFVWFAVQPKHLKNNKVTSSLNINKTGEIKRAHQETNYSRRPSEQYPWAPEVHVSTAHNCGAENIRIIIDNNEMGVIFGKYPIEISAIFIGDRCNIWPTGWGHLYLNIVTKKRNQTAFEIIYRNKKNIFETFFMKFVVCMGPTCTLEALEYTGWGSPLQGEDPSRRLSNPYCIPAREICPY